MPSFAVLVEDLDERVIAERVGLAHDEARWAYGTAAPMRVNDFEEFTESIGDYFAFHFARCVSGGGVLSRIEAAGRAKEALARHYRQRGGDIVTAFNDARDGTNGGMSGILSHLADSLKAEAVERYMRAVFDRHVSPAAWDDRVEIIRQFIAHVGAQNLPGIDASRPERYARDFEAIIRAYVNGLQRLSSVFRRF